MNRMHGAKDVFMKSVILRAQNEQWRSLRKAAEAVKNSLRARSPLSGGRRSTHRRACDSGARKTRQK